jgi:serine/threonine protein kinase
MIPERLQQVRKLFEGALAQTREERAGFLAEVCGEDLELRAEVESLLEHDERADEGFMRVRKHHPRGDRPDAGDVTETMKHADQVASSEAKLSIEGYESARELSRGGQGVVYQAIQQSTKRKVAIKVLLEGPHASQAARRRFKREIELVAQLRHPNIISIFHSGTMPDGSRFYVMDYVPGVPLDRYVRERKLGLEDTLRLFAIVCDAVQYAHQKGVIHRDLKPTNIVIDASGVPRVLDFGLAKPLTAPAASLISISQEIVGTLPYMSPEQAGGNSDEIDIRTDVYSLGVILYQLLTGRHPYPVEGRIPDVLRHITETPPTPPSRKWERGVGISRRATRRLRVGQCPIDGEIETVVLKALAKERERRYQSAGELARDIRHYLAGEPIEARGDSLAYVLWKQSRRFVRQAPVAALTLLCAILAPGLVASLLFWRQAVHERDVAEAAISFLNSDVFQSLDPERVGRDVDLRELLDIASRRIDQRFEHLPLSEASVRQTLGNLYISLGEDEKALQHLQEALRLRQQELGSQHVAVAETLVSLSHVLESRGRGLEAEHHLRRALAMRTELLGERDPLVTSTITQLAAFARRQGNLELATLLAVQLEERGVKVGAPTHAGEPTATTSEAAYRRLRDARQAYGNAHPEVAARLVELADLLVPETKFDEAEPLLVDALAIWSAQLGPEHPRTREAFRKLERVFEQSSEPEKTTPFLVERLERVLARPDNARLLSDAAWDIVKSPHHVPELYARALDAAKGACGLEPANGAYLNTLGVAQYRVGRYGEALSTLQRSDRLNDGHPADMAFLAMSLQRLDQPDAAREELRRLRNMMLRKPWAEDRQSLQFLQEAEALVRGN